MDYLRRFRISTHGPIARPRFYGSRADRISGTLSIEGGIQPGARVRWRRRIAWLFGPWEERPANRSEQFHQGADRRDLGEHQRDDPLEEIDLSARRFAAQLLDFLE